MISVRTVGSHELGESQQSVKMQMRRVLTPFNLRESSGFYSECWKVVVWQGGGSQRCWKGAGNCEDLGNHKMKDDI